MATLKHIASKNSDYSAIEAYLIYQHDAFTGKQLLDEQGRPMLRDSYILDTLECGDFSFATACLLANRKYNKNNHPDDIKSHQYIISFDPRDAADNGLTMEKAQALGLNFCKENFPGHPAIVCTHPDGHNHSGNIHVHIVIGSIRTREVERKPYMQKPRDWREGMKHSSTAQTMRHLRVAVMEMCEHADLHQINLLEAQGDRISEREYWARRRWQQCLDHANARLLAEGKAPKQTVYQTELETLRRQIDSVLKKATTFDEFSALLLQEHGIAVKESRGRLSYCPSNRVKFITARKLSKKFEKEQVLAALAQNIRLAPTVQPIAADKPDKIQKLVDIQAKSTNTSPYPDEVIDRLARAFYPAILACWNSEEGQREFAAWQAEQAHLSGKEKQEVPVGELPALLIVCGFWQGASGRAHPVFVFSPLIRDLQPHFSDTPPAHRSGSVRHTPAGRYR